MTTMFTLVTSVEKRLMSRRLFLKSKYDYTIKEVTVSPNFINAKVENDTITLFIREKKASVGTIKGQLIIMTDLPEQPKISIQIRGNVLKR